MVLMVGEGCLYKEENAKFSTMQAGALPWSEMTARREIYNIDKTFYTGVMIEHDLIEL